MEGGGGGITHCKLFEKDMELTIRFNHLSYHSLMILLSQCWTNERVETEMDLVDSAVKSLRSLANERRERYLNQSFIYFPSSFICFFG